MCIGETGLGKSTLVDSLFNTSFDSQPADHKSPDVKLKSRTYELEESNVRLNVSSVASCLDIGRVSHLYGLSF
jgi:septin 6/8/11